MSDMTEYRVVHELGPQYATPTRFIDMWQAWQKNQVVKNGQ